MELEIDVEDLLSKRRLESDRIEFKTGWNPDDIYHSVCAFANDYNNDGGGYIVVGVEEENGVAKRPVKGLPEYMLDSIQKDMLGYNNLISPPYFPQGIPAEVDGKWIFVIVVRTGQQRPYKSPEHVTSKKEKKYNYYIRYQTSSVKANSEQERELINMSDQTPFDCRANHKATFEDEFLMSSIADHWSSVITLFPNNPHLSYNLTIPNIHRVILEYVFQAFMYICFLDTFFQDHLKETTSTGATYHLGIDQIFD